MYFCIDAVDCGCCFTSGVYTEVDRAKREDKIDIDLIIEYSTILKNINISSRFVMETYGVCL